MDSKKSIENTSENLRFAAAVAQFGMLLRDSEFKGTAVISYLQLAKGALGKDAEGYRKELLELIKKPEKLRKDVATRVED